MKCEDWAGDSMPVTIDPCHKGGHAHCAVQIVHRDGDDFGLFFVFSDKWSALAFATEIIEEWPDVEGIVGMGLELCLN